MKKNVASQKWRVFAFDATDGSAKTGDAGQITAKLSKDGAAFVATDDVSPTELEAGWYEFDLLQAETNYDVVEMIAVSATGDIEVVASPARQDTEPQYSADLGIESDGDLTKVNTLDGHTAQTGDNFAQIGVNGVSLTDLGGMSTGMKAEVNAECDTALTDYDGPTKAEMDNAHGLLATEAKQDTAAGINTESRLGELDGANLPTDIAAVQTEVDKIGTPVALDGGAATVGGMLTKMSDDNGGATFDAADDSLNAIADGASGGGATAQEVWEYATRVLTAGTNLNDISEAEVNAQVDAALVDIHLDHLLHAAFPADSPPGDAASFLNAMTEDDGTTKPQFTTVGLENAPGGAAAGRYEVLGDLVQDANGNVRWCAWLEKNGQPQSAVSNCDIKVFQCDGDGTVTDMGTDQTVVNPDSRGVFNHIVLPTLEPGTEYYLWITIEFDSTDYYGPAPFKYPVRATT